MSDFIPQDVLIDIFTRLSIEDLVRSLRVSKSWYSLITNPSFISLHTQNRTSPTDNNNRLLLIRSLHGVIRTENYSIRLDNETFEEYKRLNFPFRKKNPYFRVIGCFNGVLCLFEQIKNSIILWNPTIRKSVTLPKLDHRPCYYSSTGFAFCAASNDFKVVWLLHVQLEDGCVDKVPKLEVYDLSKGCWRSVDTKGFCYKVDDQCPQAYLNGLVHWTSGTNKIVSFDMGTEELGVIQMPGGVARDWSWQSAFRVSVLEESLSLIFNYKDERICDIWVMKEYGKSESWTKLFIIDLGRSLEGAFGFLRNGEVLLQYTTERMFGFELASYDPKSKQLKLLGISGDADKFYVDNFVETLALLGVKGDTVQKTNKTEGRKRKRGTQGHSDAW